jgi:hypothetical protein
MDLPKEFFTPQSATTLTGAVAIVYVLSSTVQATFEYNPRWLALLISQVVAAFGVWYGKGKGVDYLFGLLNGCLIYLTAVGMAAIAAKASPPAATRGVGSLPPRRSFLSTWW